MKSSLTPPVIRKGRKKSYLEPLFDTLSYTGNHVCPGFEPLHFYMCPGIELCYEGEVTFFTPKFEDTFEGPFIRIIPAFCLHGRTISKDAVTQVCVFDATALYTGSGDAVAPTGAADDFECAYRETAEALAVMDCFEARAFRPLLDGSLPCPREIITPSSSCYEELFPLVDYLIRFGKSEDLAMRLKLRGMLLQCLGILTGQGYFISGNLDGLKDADPRIYEAIDDIESYYAKPHSLEELTSRLGLSREYLCRRFKKITGRTVTEFVTEVRLQNALELLEKSKYGLPEIFSYTGFETMGLFTRLFKARFGMSPAELRKALSALKTPFIPKVDL